VLNTLRDERAEIGGYWLVVEEEGAADYFLERFFVFFILYDGDLLVGG
jgi:hypothetical protein